MKTFRMVQRIGVRPCVPTHEHDSWTDGWPAIPDDVDATGHGVHGLRRLDLERTSTALTAPRPCQRRQSVETTDALSACCAETMVELTG